MSQYVDVTLDRSRRFLLTPDDWRAAIRHASMLYAMPISGNRLLMLVAEEDQSALACVLSAGCRHEDPKISTEKILKALDERLARDRAPGDPSPYEDLGEVILDSLRRIGVLRRQASPESGDEATDPNPPAKSISLT